TCLEAGLQTSPARPKRHNVSLFAAGDDYEPLRRLPATPRFSFEPVDCMPRVCAPTRSSGSSRALASACLWIWSVLATYRRDRGVNDDRQRVLSDELPLKGPGGTSMKIAQVAPLMEAVPPKLYGGSERIVAHLCNELSALGHDVTLFASGDSTVACPVAAVWPKALRLDTSISDYLAPHMMLLEAVASRGGEFDVIHSHVDYLGYPLLRRAGVPFLTTLPGRLDLPVLQHIYRTFDDVPVVTISDAQRRPVPHANYLATIQHGILERLLLPGFGAGGYLAFLGRISPEKAPDAAIRIAQKAGMSIRIAAKVDRVDRRFFEELVTAGRMAEGYLNVSPADRAGAAAPAGDLRRLGRGAARRPASSIARDG